MNPKIVWYLVMTDGRRLWLPVLMLWLAIAAAAVPFWKADLHELSQLAGTLSVNRWLADIPEFARRNAWRGAGSGMLLADLTGAVAGLLKPLLLLVCALIGVSGARWSAVRPVRRSEWIASKALETILFAGVPLAAAVGINLAVHDFPAWGTMASSAAALILPLAAMVLCGVLCGSIGRWLGWLAGFGLFFFIFLLLLRKSWLNDSGFDVWGAGGGDPLRDGIICAGLVVLIGLERRFRGSFLVTAAAWPLIIAAMLAGLWFKVPEDPAARIGASPALDRVEVPEELSRMNGRWSAEDRVLFVGMPAGTRMAGADFVRWRSTGDIVLRRRGQVIAEGAGLPSGFGRKSRTFEGRNLLAWDALMSAELDDDALMAALPADAGNLVSSLEDRASPDIFRGSVATKNLPADSLREPVDCETRYDAFLFRYEKIADLPMGGVVTGTTEDGRFRVVASFSDGARVDFSKLAGGEPDRGFSVNQIAVVLSIPEKGIAFRLPPVERTIHGDLLAGCRFSVTRHQMTEEAVYRASRLYGSTNLANARALVFAKKVLARTSRRVTAVNVAIENFRDGSRPADVSARGATDPADFFRTYLQDRPDPAGSSEEEAGRWMYRVLSLGSADAAWVARELSPFVTRHPGLALRMPEKLMERREVMDAVTDGFPADRKNELISAMREQSSDTSFAVWFRIAMNRGWKQEAKAVAMERLGRAESLSGALIFVALDCGEPSLYPKIVDRVRKGVSWNAYLLIRELPGLSDDLDQAVTAYEQDIARHSRGTIRPFMIPASRGSAASLKAILEVLASRARSGEVFREWNDLLEVVRMPVREDEKNRFTVDFRYGALKPEDFEWSAYLQQWLPKDPSFLTEP